MRDHQFAHAPDRGHIDGKRLVPNLLGGGFRRPAGDDARVVEQDVDAAEFGESPLDDAGTIVGLGMIRFDKYAACAPVSLISFSTRSPNSTRRPVMTRSAPSSANKSAVAFPIPDVAPVMMATLFESFFMSFSPSQG